MARSPTCGRPRAAICLTLALPILAGCSGLRGERAERSQAVPVARVEQQTLAPIGTAPAQPAATAQAAPPGTRPGGIGGQPVPAGTPAGPGFTPMTTTRLVGEWTALDRGGTSQCRLSLEAPVSGAPGAATPSGCVSETLFRVARWQSRGEELVLLDERNGPLLMLRPAGGGRYEGSGPGNERFAIWR